MELVTGIFLGIFGLPLFWMWALILVFLADVYYCETDRFGAGTAVLLLGTGLIAWLGGGLNVPVWLWQNLGGVFGFLLWYLLIGSVWSFVKWYFYLLKVRERWEDRLGERPVRPKESYARHNKSRLMGWIGHWPFSMVGFVLGDMLRKVVEGAYQMLRGLYDRVADHVFRGFSENQPPQGR